MFQLSKKEYADLRCQFGTSNRGGRRYVPYLFTEHGILMLANILNSTYAIQVSIMIIRTFVRLRKLIDTHKEIAQEINQLERKYDHHDYQIHKIFDAIRSFPQLKERQVHVQGFKRRKHKNDG